jgi:hypothetical protein
MSQHTPELAADEISFRPYFETVWRYRQVIGLSLVGAMVLFGIGLLTVYLRLPKERLGTIQFRLLFDGAQANTYPNGQPFNSTEIVAAPVVAEVFSANDLQQYGTLTDFQQSLFVLQSNPALQQLDFEYQGRLADTRLAAVDRAKLEDEFRRKRETMRDPQFSLSLRRSERFAPFPSPLIEKVLTDTLATWATQAIERKGAVRHNLDIVSPDMFDRAATESEHYLVRTDVLRTGAIRLLNSLTALEAIPGARAIRTQAQSSLAEEKAAVEDVIKFEVEPLLGFVRLAGGEARDRTLLSAYLSNQLFRQQLDRREAVARAQTLQMSLREYMTQRGGRAETATSSGGAGASQSASGLTGQVIPQFGESFIDRLMEMSAGAQTQDVEYRQNLTTRFIDAEARVAALDKEIAFYEDLLKQVSSSNAQKGDAAISAMLAARFAHAFKELMASVDRVQKLYAEIAAQTLNPARQLFAVTQPFTLQTLPALSRRAVQVAFVLTMLLTLSAAVVGSLLYNSYRAMKS